MTAIHINSSVDLNMPKTLRETHDINIKTKTLFQAIQDGELEGVRQALQNGAPIEGEMFNRQTPLMSAINHATGPKEEEIAFFLMESGSDLHRADEDGWTSLSYAVSVQSQRIIEKIIGAGVDPQQIDIYGQDLLQIHLQTEHDHQTEAQERAIFQIIYPFLKDTVRGKEYLTFEVGACNLLHLAAHFGRLEVIRFLVSEGWDINEQNKSGLSALHCLALSNPDLDDPNAEIIKGMQCLLGLGINTSLKTKNGKTALGLIDKIPQLTSVKTFLRGAIKAQRERAALLKAIEAVAKRKQIGDNDKASLKRKTEAVDSKSPTVSIKPPEVQVKVRTIGRL